MRSLHRGTVYYRVEENTSPSTVSETFMISIFAWVKIPYSRRNPFSNTSDIAPPRIVDGKGAECAAGVLLFHHDFFLGFKFMHQYI